MTRRRASCGGDPKKHTAVIGDVPTMWQKLAWDIDQFDEIQRSYPDIPEPLAFAAINVCISAASLRAWTVAASLERHRQERQPVTEQEIIDLIYQAVPLQPTCEAIANTAKHSRLNEGVWPGGVVRLENEEADEDTPGGFMLRHIHPDGTMESIALNAFGTMECRWWQALQSFGFSLPEHSYAFEWRQRRIRAMFGDHLSVED